MISSEYLPEVICCPDGVSDVDISNSTVVSGANEQIKQ